MTDVSSGYSSASDDADGDNNTGSSNGADGSSGGTTIELMEPPSNALYFTDDENSLLQQLVHKNYNNKSVKWEILTYLYNQSAKELINANNSAVLYKRSKEKLEQRWKDIIKKDKKKK